MNVLYENRYRTFQDRPYKRFVHYGKHELAVPTERLIEPKNFISFIHGYANMIAPREVFGYRYTKIFEAIHNFKGFFKRVLIGYGFITRMCNTHRFTLVFIKT